MSTRPAPATTAATTQQQDWAYHKALTSLWLFVASFLASLAVFALLWWLLGYTYLGGTYRPAGAGAPSGWGARGIWLLLTLVYASPLVVVVHYARQSAHLGRAHWRAPVVGGAVIAAAVPLLNAWMLVG